MSSTTRRAALAVLARQVATRASSEVTEVAQRKGGLPQGQPAVRSGTGRSPPPGNRVQRSAPVGLVLRSDGNPHRFAGIAREAGEHRFDQVRDQVLQPVRARRGLSLAYEQPLTVRSTVDLQLDAAGVDGVAVNLVPAVEEAVVPAPTPRAVGRNVGDAGPTRRAIDYGSIAVPRGVERVAIGPRHRADPLAAVVDAIVEAHQKLGIGWIVDRCVAERSHVIGDELRIMAELDAPGERRI